MRNVRAKGSPSGLNQTSANFSPRNFKAAHCSEGGCSEKFNPHLRRLRSDHYRQFGRRKKAGPHCNTEPGRGKERGACSPAWLSGTVIVTCSLRLNEDSTELVVAHTSSGAEELAM